MATTKTKYRRPPLTEAVFAVHWALQNVADAIKYDTGLEQAVYRLRESYKDTLSGFERRLPHGFGVPFTLNYQPAYRFYPPSAEYPQVQLGSGVFVVREDGEAYVFDPFKELVVNHLGHLKVAYLNLGEAEAALLPRQYSFQQLNRIELTEWDSFIGRPAPEQTLASEFIRDQLNFDLTTPLKNLRGSTLFRQELARSFELDGDVGILSITVRDVSESKSEQIVEWEQEVLFTEVQGELDPAGAGAWLKLAHDYTHEAFGLVCVDDRLLAFFDRD